MKGEITFDLKLLDEKKKKKKTVLEYSLLSVVNLQPSAHPCISVPPPPLCLCKCI